jgi:hypothetical protein
MQNTDLTVHVTARQERVSGAKSRPGDFLVGDGQDPAQSCLCHIWPRARRPKIPGFLNKYDLPTQKLLLYQVLRSWLCWQSAANRSLPVKFPDRWEDRGKSVDFGVDIPRAAPERQIDGGGIP